MSVEEKLFRLITEKLLTTTSIDTLRTLYNNCYHSCTYLVRGDKTCDIECEKEYCTQHTPCSILMFSGKRKGEACGKIKCIAHKGLIMCDHSGCLHTCSKGDTTCDFHIKENKIHQELSKPIIPIRYENTKFVIRGTMITFNVGNQTITGYLKEEDGIMIHVQEENEDIQKLCAQYKITTQFN